MEQVTTIPLARGGGRTSNYKVELWGELYTPTQTSAILGISIGTVWSTIYSTESIADAIDLMVARANHKKARIRYPKEYKVFHSMLARCGQTTGKKKSNGVNIKFQHNYGERGIKVCDRWLGEKGFCNFIEDMGPRPNGTASYDRRSVGERPKYSIDRIDPDGDYCPENCRWADSVTQGRNKRNNHIIKAFGEKLTLSDWSDKLGIERTTICERLRKGETPEQALGPLRRNRAN